MRQQPEKNKYITSVSLNGKEIGKVDILATEDVEEISYGSAMKEAVRGWTL